MAAVARQSDCGGIGIDLEHRDRYFAGLAEEIADSEERRYIEELPAVEGEIATMELFSAKETVYKAFYPRVQRYFGFDEAHIEMRPGSAPLTGWFVSQPDMGFPRRHFEIHRMWSSAHLLTWLVLPPDHE